MLQSIQRTVGPYRIIVSAVPCQRRGLTRYFGSVNAVPSSTSAAAPKSGIYDFDGELFDTPDAAANYALDKALLILAM